MELLEIPDLAEQSLRELRGRVESWLRGRLAAQVILGLILGIAVGFVLGPDVGWLSTAAAEKVGQWLALPGHIFLGLISMVLIPLVVGSVVSGLNGSQSAAELRRVGSRFLLFVLVTTVVAAVLGILLAREIQPGAPMRDQTAPAVADKAAGETEAASVPEALLRMLPTNPAVAVAEQDMLAVVFLAVLFGIAIRVSDNRKIAGVVSFIEGTLELSMRVVQWAMYLTPWAVFGLMAQLIAKIGIRTLLGMTAYVLTVAAGLLAIEILYLVLVAVVGRRNPFSFLKSTYNALLLAFSTSSSAAVMPLSIDTAVKKLRVPEGIASLVIPLGATINMAGGALYQSVAILFLAQVSGIELTVGDQALIVVALVAASIGSPGTPGVGIVILGNIALRFGIPVTALPLILGVDRVLDMCRTIVNVTGDLTACVILSGGDSDSES